MILHLVRHGLAEPPGAGGEDSTRHLTPEGARRIQQQAVVMARAGIQLDRLFCSPYLRARQTADLIGAALDITPQEDKRLAPGARMEGVADLLGEHGNPARAMLVGHQPDIGYITLELTGNTVPVREGTLIVVDVPALRSHRCSLAGLYDPDVMLSLAGHLLSE
jgi:phosphohistidine phosphatase